MNNPGHWSLPTCAWLTVRDMYVAPRIERSEHLCFPCAFGAQARGGMCRGHGVCLRSPSVWSFLRGPWLVGDRSSREATFPQSLRRDGTCIIYSSPYTLPSSVGRKRPGAHDGGAQSTTAVVTSRSAPPQARQNSAPLARGRPIGAGAAKPRAVACKPADRSGSNRAAAPGCALVGSWARQRPVR